MAAYTSNSSKFAPGLQLGNTDGQTLDSIVSTVNSVVSGGNTGASVATGLVATGSSLAGALPLSSRINKFTSVGASTGALLPAASNSFNNPLDPITVFNGGANALTVYGTGTDTIDGSAGSSGVPLSATGRAQFFATTSGGWDSAQLGAKSA